jgi:c-di-GMP-binding flagellar brake protein YcgR
MLNLASRENTVETEPDDLAGQNQYAVGSRLEILQILAAIMRQGALVTASPGGNSFFLTAITAIDEDDGTLLLECGRQQEQIENVLKQQRLKCSTALDKVKIQFMCEGIEIVDTGRGLAFKMPLPQEMIRLQRREHFRIGIPMASPVKCAIFLPEPEPAQPAKVELSVHDISGGGIAVITPPALFTPEIGAEYSCLISLPGTTGARALIQARNAFMITLANGKVTQRSGFAFVRPAESLLATIQRYIMNLERARRMQSNGR